MSHVVYGGFKLPLVKTNTLSQESIYTEDGIDYMYTKYTLDCNCLVTLDSLNVVPELDGINEINQKIEAFREFIMQPRRAFQFSLGDQDANMIEIGAPDIAGGPFPKSFNIVEIQGANAAVMSFTIEAHKSDCPDDREGDESEILSNRFAVTTRYDQNFYATRTITGKLVLKGRTNPQPDEFRNVVMPELPHGYRRNTMDFQVASNGLTLAYTIVDLEKFLLDSASTTVSGSYTEESINRGAKVFGQLDISLSAPKNFAKAFLYIRAVEIAFSRVTEFDFLLSASVREELFDNTVQFRLRFQKEPTAVNRIKSGFALLGNRAGLGISDPTDFVRLNLPKKKVRVEGQEVFFNDRDFFNPEDATAVNRNQHSADLSIRNEEIIRAAVVAWKDPCVQKPDTVRYKPMDEDVPEEDLDDPEPEITVTEVAKDEDLPVPNYGSDHLAIDIENKRSFMLMEADIEIDYKTLTNVIQLPIANGPKSTDSPFGLGDEFNDDVFVILSRPRMVKTISWTFERVDKQPSIPNPFDEYIVPNTNGTVKARLLKKVISPNAAQLAADGKKELFSISGAYEYGFNRVLTEEQKELDIGSLPWDSSTVRGQLDNKKINLSDEIIENTNT